MATTQTITRRTAKAFAEPKAKTARKPRPDTDLTAALEKILGGEDEVVIYKNGKKVGAMISARAFKFLMKKVREEEDRRDIETIRQARAKGEKTIPWEQLKAELGL